MEFSGRPVVFTYTDYRLYLKDHIAWERSQEPGLSLRSLSARITPSLSTSSLLSHVLKGVKNIGAQLRRDFIKWLRLKHREARYFDLLVQFNQAVDLQERSSLFAQLSRFTNSRAKRVYEHQFRFFTKWYYLVIWNYFGVTQSERNAADIAEAMNPALTPAQVREGIDLLLELGLIKKLANGYSVTDKHLATDPEFRGLEAVPFSEMFLNLAVGALHGIEPEHRRFGTVVFSASKATFEHLKEKVSAFQEEVQELIAEDNRPEGVFTFSFQLFPNTHPDLGQDRKLKGS